MKLSRLIPVSFAVFAFAVSAKASNINIVTNPNFSATGYTYPGYTGYSQTGGNGAGCVAGYCPTAGANAVAGWTPSGFGVGSNTAGQPFWDNGNPGVSSVGFIQGNNSWSQNLTHLNVGLKYVFSYEEDARNCCGAYPTLTFSVGGTALHTDFLNGPNGFITVNGSFIATSSTEQLLFSSTTPGDATALVTAVSVNATPEPSSLALLGTGVLSVAGMARRKFRKA